MYDVKTKFGPNGDVVQATNTQPGMHAHTCHACRPTNPGTTTLDYFEASQGWCEFKKHDDALELLL